MFVKEEEEQEQEEENKNKNKKKKKTTPLNESADKHPMHIVTL